MLFKPHLTDLIWVTFNFFQQTLSTLIHFILQEILFIAQRNLATLGNLQKLSLTFITSEEINKTIQYYALSCN